MSKYPQGNVHPDPLVYECFHLWPLQLECSPQYSMVVVISGNSDDTLYLACPTVFTEKDGDFQWKDFASIVREGTFFIGGMGWGFLGVLSFLKS